MYYIVMDRYVYRVMHGREEEKIEEK